MAPPDSFLGAIIRIFTTDSEDDGNGDLYPEWECPHCDLDLQHTYLKNEKTGETSTGAKVCLWCGWSENSEPDVSPEEAFERYTKQHQRMGERINER